MQDTNLVDLIAEMAPSQYRRFCVETKDRNQKQTKKSSVLLCPRCWDRRTTVVCMAEVQKRSTCGCFVVPDDWCVDCPVCGRYSTDRVMVHYRLDALERAVQRKIAAVVKELADLARMENEINKAISACGSVPMTIEQHIAEDIKAAKKILGERRNVGDLTPRNQ